MHISDEHGRVVDLVFQDFVGDNKGFVTASVGSSMYVVEWLDKRGTGINEALVVLWNTCPSARFHPKNLWRL